MKFLLTGGAGNLGSRLAIPLVRRGDKVIAYDVKIEPHFASPEFERVVCVKGDLGGREKLAKTIEEHQVDSIFHLGAVLSAAAEEHPHDAWRANMEGMANVLEVARLGGVKRVIFASTIATYGERAGNSLVDDTPQWPSSLYGVTKVAGERLGYYYDKRFGIDFRGIRLPAVIAGRGATGGASAYCSAAFEKSISKGTYEFDVRPTTRAPMVYITDAVGGLLRLHEAPKMSLTRNVYNVFSVAPSAEELAAAIKKRLPQVRITYKPDPLKTEIVESWPSQIDDSAARRDWNWDPISALDEIADEVFRELKASSPSLRELGRKARTTGTPGIGTSERT